MVKVTHYYLMLKKLPVMLLADIVMLMLCFFFMIKFSL